MYFLSEKPKHILLEKILAWSGYLLFIVVTGVIGVLIILHYSGYSFNRSGEVTRTGFVTVTSNPVKASVFLDGKQLKGQTYMRLDIPVGEHSFVVRADGYQEWTRDITVEPSGVYWLDYIILYPKNLTPYALQDIKSYHNLTALRGQDKLIGYDWQPTNLDVSLIDLKNRSNDNANLNRFTLADLSLQPDEQISSVELLKVDRIQKVMLLKLNTESGSNLLFYDIDKPDEIVNLSKKYSINPDNIGFTYDDYYQLYYVDIDDNLRIVNLKTDLISKPLISTLNLSDFTVKNQDSVYYADVNDKLFLKKYSEEKPKLLSELPVSGSRRKIKYVSYDSIDYIIDYANLEDARSTFNIWAASNDQLSNRFSTELDGTIDRTITSKDERTIFASTNKGDLASFVFDDRASGRFKLNDYRSNLDWASPFQLSYIGEDGLHLVDFTGDNNKLIAQQAGQKPYLISDDFKNIYYLTGTDTDNLLKLNSIDMVTK
jgi:hypothetical protein